MKSHTSRDHPDVRDLIKLARAGDTRARDEIITTYYELAEKACFRHARRKGVDRDDAQSEVFFTITDAIYGYDLRHTRTSFAAYISQRARGAITWADRQLRQQDLRKLNSDWNKTFAGPGGPGKGHRPRKDKPLPKATEEDMLIGKCFQLMSGDKFRQWLRQCPRRTDRLIATWLWWRRIPLSQSVIARKLKMSRSAVCQRRKILFALISGVSKNNVTKQMLINDALNKIKAHRYYPFWDDLCLVGD